MYYISSLRKSRCTSKSGGEEDENSTSVSCNSLLNIEKDPASNMPDPIVDFPNQ